MDDTPSRLVAAATRLIADGGEEATSLRAVSRAARSNAAAVHYHFGGRDELLAAVLFTLLEPVQARRLELLDEARRRHGDPLPPAAVAEALLRPDLELLERLRPDQVRVARMAGRPPAPPGSAVAALLERHVEALAARVSPGWSLPADELRDRLRFVRAAAGAALAHAAEHRGGPDEDTVDGQLARLVGFCAAGLAAPATRAEPAVKAARGKPKKRKKDA